MTSKLFNARIFNKGEMWKILSKAGFAHTPHTARLNGLNSLEKMISLHKSVYLKRVSGCYGIGIQRIEKMPKGYLFKEESGTEKWAGGPAQVMQLIMEHKKKGPYIIQQG